MKFRTIFLEAMQLAYMRARECQAILTVNNTRLELRSDLGNEH